MQKYASEKKIIFLDRDGVINKKASSGLYITNKKQFEFLPNAIKGLQFLTEKNCDIFIITNQPGIARKQMTEKDLKEIHEKLLLICKQNGIRIKRIYYCPHGRDDGCICRKPKPGLLLKAAAENNFDITKAIFIGDDQRDVLAGEAAGCRTILMKPNGNLLEVLQTQL